MTREEAKDLLLNISAYDIDMQRGMAKQEAIEMAIKVLEQEPCGDVISRQAVKEQMIKYGFHAPDMTVTEFVEALPSVSTEKTERWIPVSEKLPKNSGRYLACIVNKHDDKLQYIMTCDYSVDGPWHWFPDDECASDNVVAWMPLPEPYKTESEDKG